MNGVSRYGQPCALSRKRRTPPPVASGVIAESLRNVAVTRHGPRRRRRGPVGHESRSALELARAVVDLVRGAGLRHALQIGVAGARAATAGSAERTTEHARVDT